jgi:hypothetical protein
MFKNFNLLFLMMGLFGSFVVDDSVGGSEVDFESYDMDVDDGDDANATESQEATTTPQAKEVTEPESKETDEIIKRLEEAEAKLQAQEQERLVQTEIQRLSSEHKGFDADAVKSKLKEIHKTDPQRAEMLNNPVGWENLWLKELAPKSANNDDISFGRNVDPIDRQEEFMEKINSGEGLTLDEQAQFFA